MPRLNGRLGWTNVHSTKLPWMLWIAVTDSLKAKKTREACLQVCSMTIRCWGSKGKELGRMRALSKIYSMHKIRET
jgi:hypothetical protein